jgi:parallel beta-helix repeat protein
MITGCTANNNLNGGILVVDDCQVVGNTCVGNSNVRDAAGIHVMGTDNSIRENYAKGNERGISVDVAGNFIVKNTAANNSLNYFITDEINQTLGKIMKAGDNIAAPAWANFEF